MRLRALTIAVAILATTAAPATAARRQTISDGFTMSGIAGSQAVVHLTHEIDLNDWWGRDATYHVSNGAVAGFALFGVGRTRDRILSVETPKDVACGDDPCSWSSRLRYSLGDGYIPPGDGDQDRPGDYVVVLLGTHGARVDVTVNPKAKGRKPVRIVPTHTANALVMPTSDTSTIAGDGTELVASGTATLRDRHGRGALVLVHTADFRYGTEVDYDLKAGAVSKDECGVHTWSGHNGPYDDLETIDHYHSTEAFFADVGSGDVCVAWEAQTTAVQADQAGLLVYVPLVAR